MNVANAAREMQNWFARYELGFKDRRITARLWLPSTPGLDKATTTLETPTHVASLTAWGNGTVEFAVIDTETKADVISRDNEYATAAELLEILDGCVRDFERLVDIASSKRR